MPSGNEEKKDSAKACGSLAAHTDVISMLVTLVKVKYKDPNSVDNTFPMLDNFSQGYFA